MTVGPAGTMVAVGALIYGVPLGLLINTVSSTLAMARDAERMRGEGPTVMAAVKKGVGLDEIEQHILTAMHTATQHSGAGAHSHEHSH